MHAVQDLPAPPTEHVLTAHAVVRMRHAALGLDLSAAEGLQVLVGPDGAVVTMYRNHDLRSITASARRVRHPHRTAHH